MFGAIIGDIAGSRFEGSNHKSKDFELLAENCSFTDDTVMSVAIAYAILNSRKNIDTLPSEAIKAMQAFGQCYRWAGYGGAFSRWIRSTDPQPYNSWGNGAAMRVSACGFAANSIDEVKQLSRAVTEVTHNHPEGIKGAEAVAVAVFMAKSGKSMKDIREYITANYYDISFTLDEIREEYRFDVSCQGSVPQAFEAFFESINFEDAIRNAISIGGDSDTIAAIAGSIAEAYYGIPDNLKEAASDYLDEALLRVINIFESTYPRITKANIQ